MLCMLLAVLPPLDCARGQPLSGVYSMFIDPLEAPLRADPAFQSGTLDNGVRYHVRHHGAPPGQVMLRLVVEAGSLSETNEERGAAFLTAMLLYTSSIESRLGRAVLDLGEALPARRRAIIPKIAQDAVTFSVTLPIADEKALRIGLRYLATLVAPGCITDDVVLRFRPAALALRAPMSSRKDRLVAAVLPQLDVWSRAAGHPAIPTDESLCALTTEAVSGFHAQRYAPRRLTVIAVGDAPTGRLAEFIKEEFGGLEQPPGSRSMQPAPSDPPRSGIRAAVASDPEMTQAVAEIVVLHPEPPPKRTVGRWRGMLLDRVAAALLHRVLADAAEDPGGPVRGAGIRIGSAPGTMFAAVASVTGESSDWKRLVAEVAARVSRARLAEPDAEAFSAALRSVRRMLEESASEADADSSVLVERATEAALRGDVLLDPREEVIMADRWLRTITPAEVAGVIGERFRMLDAGFVVFLPQRAEQPSPVDVLAAALPAVLAGPGAPAAAGRLPAPDALALPDPPAPRGPDSFTIDPISGVTTAQFAGGVRLRHRFMQAADARVSMSFTLTDPERGNGDATVLAAGAVFASPATRGISSSEMRRLLAEHRIDLRCHAVVGGIRLDVSCTRSSAGHALQAVHLLLTQPVVEPGAFERWRWSMIQRCRARSIDPEAAADDAAFAAIGSAGTPGSPFQREDHLRSLSLDTLQRLVVESLGEASIDAAITGDMPRSEALSLASRYIGSLPARRGMGGREAMKDPVALPGFTERRLDVRSPSPEAVVLVGIRGAGPDARSDAALDLAARILMLRLDDPRRGAARAVVVRHIPGASARNGGLFFAIGTTEPPSAAPLASLMEEAFTSLGRHGPTESELIRARSDAIEEFDHNVGDPAWWARMLASPRGVEPADLQRTRQRLASMTPAGLREVFAAHDPAACCNAPRLRILVVPTGESCDPR